MHAAVAVPPAIVVGAGEVCPNEDQMQLTDDLRREYSKLFADVGIAPERKIAVQLTIAKIARAADRYRRVADATSVPWWVIALIHTMECDGNFDCHLHNGDPLTARTVNEPKGRPVSGAPTFTWEVSAIDALTYERMPDWKDWSIPGSLFKLESYNGFGARNRGVHTPYLWGASFDDLNGDGIQQTNEPPIYVGGKYVKDHVWDPRAQSKQIGAAVLLRRMMQMNLVSLSNDSSASNCESQKGPTP